MIRILRPLWKKLRGSPRSSTALNAEFVTVENSIAAAVSNVNDLGTEFNQHLNNTSDAHSIAAIAGLSETLLALNVYIEETSNAVDSKLTNGQDDTGGLLLIKGSSGDQLQFASVDNEGNGFPVAHFYANCEEGFKVFHNDNSLSVNLYEAILRNTANELHVGVNDNGYVISDPGAFLSALGITSSPGSGMLAGEFGLEVYYNEAIYNGNAEPPSGLDTGITYYEAGKIWSYSTIQQLWNAYFWDGPYPVFWNNLGGLKLFVTSSELLNYVPRVLSPVDNTIVRFNNNQGAQQSSGCTIDDANILTAAGFVFGLGGTPVMSVRSATAALNFGSIPANSFLDLVMTVTTAAVGDTVLIAVPSGSLLADLSFFGWVSAVNTVVIRCTNNSATTARDPASGTFRATIIKF